MSLKYGTLCFVLFLVVVFLAVKNYEALTSPLELTPDKGTAKKEAKLGNPPAVGAPKESTPITSFNAIAERNIFNPERKDFPATGSGMSKNPVVRPQIVLYGITIAGDYQFASVVNPGRPLKKGEREQMTLKLGERIGEYKLAKVSSDRVTLEAEGDAFEILLYDPKMPKKRTEVKTESKPATITSAQASSTGASDLRKEGGPAGASTSTSPPIGTQKPPVRREAAEGTKEAVREKTSPSQIIEPAMPPMTPSTPSGPAPTPTQIPAPMALTPMVPPFTPVPLTPPPGMGKPAPLTSGAPTQTPSTGGK